MLIPYQEVVKILQVANKNVRGILHIGAHECEELNAYVENGVSSKCIDWVEANPELVERMAHKNIQVHCAAIHDEEKEFPFYITNNGQSSSLLSLGTHKQQYPNIHVTKTVIVKTKTLESFINENHIDIANRNFWNLDIQGSELSALQSAGDYIRYADAIYVEVNTEEVYQGCGKLEELDTFLQSKGFLRFKTLMTRAGWGDALYLRVSETK